MKSKLRHILLLVILFYISVLLYKPIKIDADVIDNSMSEHTVTNNGLPVLKVVMREGQIDITAISHTATTSVKWKTVGFTITRNPLTSMSYNYAATEGTYPLSGYQNVSTVYDGGYGTLYIQNAVDKESIANPATGMTTTTYRFSADQVEAALKGDKFSTITKDTPIYLHCIFDTYQEINGKEITRKSNLINWKDILLAEYWNRSDGQLEGFAKYFNMKLEFQPAPQKNTIYFYNDKNKPLQKEKALASILPGQKVSWSKEPAELTSGGANYELYKYVVTQKGKGVNKPISGGTHFIGDSDGCTLAKIQSGSTTVLLGGMDIYLYYREREGAKIVIRAVDEGTGTVIKDKLYEGKVEANQKFNQAVDTTILYSGKTYQKTNFNYYTYRDKSNVDNEKYFNLKNSEDPIAFTIPSNIKSGSTIVVTVYYELAAQGTIPVIVKAINKDSGVAIKTLATDSIQAGENYSYTINETLASEGKNYNYTGEWKWSYKEKSSAGPTISKSGSSTRVSFKAPNADKIDGGITVNIYYKVDGTASGEITLRVIMVSSTGATIDVLSEETVTRNQSINKTISRERSVKGIMYEYQNKWDYNYYTDTNNQTKNGSGITATFTIPSTTKMGSVVTLRIYYSAVSEVEVPEAAPPISLPMDSPTPYGVINGDKYSAPYFTSEKGISTTESQYVFVRTKDYLLGYTLVNRTGKVTYYVPVTMNYTLNYFTATPEEFGGPKEVVDNVTDTQHIKVERAYSYWEIANLEYYNVNFATVYNYSLPDGSVRLNTNNSYLNIPSLSTSHSSNILDHVLPPKQVTEGIVLNYETPITSETSDRPLIEYEDLTSYALTMTEEATVKNDYIMFNGRVVLSNSATKKIAPSPNVSSMVHTTTIIPDKALYTEGKVIDARKLNGTYSSNGSVSYYLHPLSVKAGISLKNYPVSVNDVVIHTPVICEPIISSDNAQWSQLIQPEEDAYHIVLDPDRTLNDFTVKISNTLQHSKRLGYYERDFSRSLIDPTNTSYIAKINGIVRNEMKLPFDVYVDNLSDNNPENDQFIKAGTWIILGRSTSRFYVPMWVQEGVYTAEFRTVAVNGEDKLKNTETTRNANINSYVAVSQKKFQISGRIYGLTLYDLYDYPNWENIFRIKNTMLFKYFEGAEDGTKRSNYNEDDAYYYTVGTKNQYGKETERLSKYTAPIVNNSHPQYKNLGVLKTGYAVRFMVDTTGEMYSTAHSVKITPTFYYVDEEGKKRQRVDLYYSEEINGKQYDLLKVGEGIDLTNIKTGTTGNIYSRIPDSELRHTAKVLDTSYSKLYHQIDSMYSYSDIRLLDGFRTFIGIDYASNISKLPSYNDVKKITGQTELGLSKYMQRWYGTYKLPMDVYIAPAGYDVYGYLRKHGIDYKENFWLKEGYIIVNFNIVTIDKNGKQNLCYTNRSNYLKKGHNSMWVTEGAPLQKTDNKGALFNLKAGDYLVFYSDKRYKDDFYGVLN